MKIKYFSFDVFDTCLLRACGNPSAVFKETYEIIKKNHSKFINDISCNDYITERILAEKMSRLKSPSGEVSLIQIWQTLCENNDIKFSVEYMEAELSCEKSNLVANLDILRKINKLREKKVKIRFVSDMYLPHDFILEQLKVWNFFKEGDSLYVSNQFGLTKRTGKLYDYILGEECAKAKSWVHVGDHIISDYKVPKKKGIQCIHYKASQYSNLELKIIRSSFNLSHELVPIASAMRQYRLSKKNAFEVDLVGNFMGPVLILVAKWILQIARDKKIKKLFFCSRDCQSLYYVAKILTKNENEIECKYLLVSRQSLMLPSSKQVSPDGLPWLFRSFEQASIRSLLAKLELNADHWSDYFSLIHNGEGVDFIIESEQHRALFWDIIKQPLIRTEIEKSIAIRKDFAVQYFTSCGLMTEDSSGIVDLGWHGNCIESIRSIVSSKVSNPNLSAFLLGLVKEKKKCITVPMYALFKQLPDDDPLEKLNNCIFHHITDIEHILGMADHPSVMCYETGKALFSHTHKNQSELREKILSIHNEIQDFASIYSKIGKKDALCVDSTRNAVAELMNNFWNNPSKNVIRNLSAIQKSGDQNNLNYRPLIEPFTLKILLFKILNRFIHPNNALGKLDFSWYQASYTISSFPVKALLWMMEKLKK